MTSPPLPAITLNACLLVGCAATLVHRGASFADEPITNPTGGGASVQLEPVPPKPTRSRAVFVCHSLGHVIFSDRPCGPTLEQHTVTTTTPPTGQAASTVPPPARAATRPRVQPSPKPEPLRVGNDRCVKLREQLEKLDDRMRSGYSAREAARLWNRWRDLKSEIYAARC